MIRTAILTVALALIAVAICSDAVSAQKQAKPWTEWSKKDAEKILKDSPWSHMQTDTDTAEMFYQPTADSTRAPNSGARTESGATNQSTNVQYGIRIFSARPIRQAFMRTIMLQRQLEPDVQARLTQYAELESTSSIIIAVTVESTDKKSLGKIMQIVNSANTGALKNMTYLERKDGKRLFLEEYTPPGSDGFGARFIFPRNVEEKPFLTPDAGEVRFVSEFPSAVKLNMTFKLAEMLYNGAFEY
jgi:hypothetical protein